MPATATLVLPGMYMVPEKLRIGGKTIPVVLKTIPVVLVVVRRLVHNEPNSIVGCLASYK